MYRDVDYAFIRRKLIVYSTVYPVYLRDLSFVKKADLHYLGFAVEGHIDLLGYIYRVQIPQKSDCKLDL